ncbi:hypothetical protein CHUAL_008848 [Chamberlinius hualienensis]
MKSLFHPMSVWLILGVFASVLHALPIEENIEDNVGIFPVVDATRYSFSNATTYPACSNRVLDICDDCWVRYEIDFGNETATRIILKYSNMAEGPYFGVEVFIDENRSTSTLMQLPPTPDWCSYELRNGEIDIGPGVHSLYLIGFMDIEDDLSTGINIDSFTFQ